MSLEHSYRRLLRAYPRSYRERRGEEIIATLMDDADPAQSRPDRHAVADLLLGGLRERLGLHNPDGLAAGAALVAPVGLALAVLGAFSVVGDGSLMANLVGGAWAATVAVWSMSRRSRSVSVALAFGLTCAALWSGPEGLWPVACWGLVTLIGSLSVVGPSAYRTSVVRFGIPVVVAILGLLTLWSPVLPLVGSDPASPILGATWYGVINDLVIFGAMVGGVAAAGVRHAARVIWAGSVVLGAWWAAGGGATSYLWENHHPVGLPIELVIESSAIRGSAVLAPLALLVVAVVIARRVGGPLALHRAGGVVMGFAVALVVTPLLDLARGGEYSLWSGDPLRWDAVGPLWIGLLAVAVLPVVADFWAPVWVQRSLVVAAIVAAVSAAVLVPTHTGPIFYVVYFLVLGLCTRSAGVRDLGALTGLALGLTYVILVLPSVALVTDVALLWHVGSVAWLAAFFGIVAGPAVTFAASGRVWLAAASFVVGALTLVAETAVDLLPFMLLGAVLGLSGLGLSRYVRRPSEPPQEPA